MSLKQPLFNFGNGPADFLRFELSQLEQLITELVNLFIQRFPVLDFFLQENVRHSLIPLRRRQHLQSMRGSYQSHIDEPPAQSLGVCIAPHLAPLFLNFHHRVLQSFNCDSECSNGCADSGRDISNLLSSLKRLQSITQNLAISSNPLNKNFFVVQACCPAAEAFEQIVVVLFDELIKLRLDGRERPVSGKEGHSGSHQRCNGSYHRSYKSQPVGTISIACETDKPDHPEGKSKERKGYACAYSKKNGMPVRKFVHADKMPSVWRGVERVAA
ncbi:hypothetical protein SAMN04487925_101710 [Bradyrhizobium sp. cf659]|nr:hypothetical protein SAMN04487925_101710 [Bradyrhizobium sp. cf659]